MHNKSCENCYYGDICPSNKVCPDYYPVVEEAETDLIEEIVEADRAEYRSAWFEYINEFNN